jgi:hypothetical protein
MYFIQGVHCGKVGQVQCRYSRCGEEAGRITILL